MGSYDIYPNMYIMFVGPAGGPRKSTTANASDILLGIPGCTAGPEMVTKEALLAKMVKDDRENAIYVLAPEFGEFIIKSGNSMYGFLTNLYDGKANLGDVTLSRGTVFAEKPCINLLGATTPEWVAENMPLSVIGGGYASRVIIISEESVRRRKLFYDDVPQIPLLELRENLRDDLAHIATEIKGDFKFDSKETMKWTEDWYIGYADSLTAEKYKIIGYYNRRHVHALKIAMLLHISYSDELVITLDDVQSAIKLLEDIEDKLPNAFNHIGKNKNTGTLELIKRYIDQSGKVSALEIKKKFLHAFESGDDLLKNLVTLQEIQEIKMVRLDDELYYIPYPKKESKSA